MGDWECWIEDDDSPNNDKLDNNRRKNLELREVNFSFH